MNVRRQFTWFTTACAFAVVTGCGGSDGGGSVDITADLAAGRAALKLLAANPNPTSNDVKDALDPYTVAYNKAQGNSQAKAMYALTLAGYHALTFIECSGISARAALVPRTGNRPVSGTGPERLAKFVLTAARLGLAGGSNPTRGDVGTCALVFRTNLGTAASLLDSAAQDPNFGYVLDNFHYDSTDPQSTLTITVDHGDLLVLDGALNAGLALLDLASAFTLNPGTFDFSPTINSAFGGAPAVTPAQYLPPPPFGTFNQASGPGLLLGARTEFNRAYDAGISAVTALQARSDKKNHVLDNSTATVQDYQAVTSALQALKQSLSGPASVPYKDQNGDPATVTLNFNAWITNPPASLVAFAPTWSASGSTYVVSPASYPDRTFGGIFPNNAPDAALSNQLNDSQSVGQMALGIVPFAALISELIGGGLP